MNKILEVVLKLTDQFTAPLQKSEGGLKSFGTGIKNLVAGAVSLGGIAMALNKAFAAADELTVSLRKLEGTAKITGTPLNTLQQLAGEAARKFGLSRGVAADLTVEMVKLAKGAGDVGLAGPAMQAFLDIGAARGLTAEQTLKAVQQAILGIDEGTDKLFNANPSVLYARFAESIGTTAGKLDGMQKNMALLTAGMEDGKKVAGAFGEMMLTVAGQMQVSKVKSDEAWASLGLALESTRMAMAGAVGWFAEKLQAFVGGMQLIGNDIGYFFARIPAEIELMWRALMMAVAWGVEKLGSLIPFVGDKLEEAGRRMGASQKAQGQQTLAHLNALREAHEQAAFDIVGISTEGQRAQTAALEEESEKRSELSEKEVQARVSREKDAQEGLKKLRQNEEDAKLEAMTALGRGMYELQRQMDAAMLSEDAATRDEAARLWKNGVARMMGEYAKIEPSVRGVTLQVRTEMATLPPAIDAATDAADRKRKKLAELKADLTTTAFAIAKAANEALAFADAIGGVNPQLESLIGGIGQLAQGIGGIASGNLIQGIAGAVSGLQGIVGSLFGSSPAEEARKRLLKENSERLRELRDSVGDLTSATLPGAKISAFRGINFDEVFAASRDSMSGRINQADLAKFLLSKGLTLGDFKELAENMGGNLVEQGAGFFSGGSVKQIFDMLALWKPGSFNNSFDSQIDAIRSEFGVAGRDDPRAQLQSVLGVLKAQGGTAISSLVEGADLTTQAGVDNLRAQMATWVAQARTDEIPAGVFGGLSPQEFMQALDTVSDLLGQFTFTVTPPGGTPPTGDLPPGLMTGGVTSAATFAGLSFAQDTIDVRNMFGAPIARMDMGIGKLVEFAEAGSVGGTINNYVTIGTLSAGTPADAAAQLATALDEEMRLQRDRSALLRGQ